MTAAGPGWAAAPARAPADWTLVYDGDCRFCFRCVRFLTGWDTRHRLRFVPFQDAVALAALPPIPRAELEEAMHLVSPNGIVSAEAEAARGILQLLPGGPPLAALFRVPGVPTLAGAIYRAIARNRHRLGCGSAQCRRGR